MPEEEERFIPRLKLEYTLSRSHPDSSYDRHGWKTIINHIEIVDETPEALTKFLAAQSAAQKELLDR